MTVKIKAAVLEKIKKPLKIKNLNYNRLSRGQVLVKIYFSGVCGSQIMEINGSRGKDKWLPHCLGHEASGEVEAIGDGVKKVRKGDKVILTWLECTGIDANNAIYESDSKKINSGKITTFSNYTIVSENRVIKKPKNINMKNAVLYGCAIPTGFGMVINEVKPKKSQQILLIGLGGIGMSVLMGLKCLKHSSVIIADISKQKLEFAKKMGFRNCVDTSKENLGNYLNGLENKDIDICIETAGKVKTIELGFSLIKYNGGKLYFASHPDSNHLIKINPHELIRGKNIFGSWGGKTQPDKDIPKIAKMINKNKIELSNLLFKTYPLNKINLAINDLKAGNVIRPIIKMQHK